MTRMFDEYEDYLSHDVNGVPYVAIRVKRKPWEKTREELWAEWRARQTWEGSGSDEPASWATQRETEQWWGTDKGGYGE